MNLEIRYGRKRLQYTPEQRAEHSANVESGSSGKSYKLHGRDMKRCFLGCRWNLTEEQR